MPHSPLGNAGGTVLRLQAHQSPEGSLGRFLSSLPFSLPCTWGTVLLLELSEALPGQGASAFLPFWILELQTHVHHIDEEAHASVHLSTQHRL